ncbi:hypothetical protein AB6A40_003819 [Gnathostoma spinigerum]|uniref:DNA polymerase kappa n=1 Tax=Gnathostoma spinigerum TaxID=75299 RepID=A0ABD6EBT7_9BILA
MEVFNDNKAGLDGVDKDRIQKIINQNTGSNYQEYSRKRTERIEARIRHNDELLKALSLEAIAKAELQMDSLVIKLESERDLSRVIVHIDMDAFYAAVEMRDDPSLRNLPMAVGSTAMLSTSNYAARRYGVRSAMPGFIARKLCPELKIVPCNFQKYRSVSQQIREVLRDYDPEPTMNSLDEAYLDLTDCIRSRIDPVQVDRKRYSGACSCRLPQIRDGDLPNIKGTVNETQEMCDKCGKESICIYDFVEFGTDVEEVVREIRFRIEQSTGLTCSAGIGPNSMIAKICSDRNKPNGQFGIENEKTAVVDFMRDLSIRKVSGIGQVTEAVLRGLGIEKCGDLFRKRGILRMIFTERSYEYFLRISLGIQGASTDHSDHGRKSISNERTIQPTAELKVLLDIARDLCEELMDSLSEYGVLGGRTVTVKIKFSTFDVVTKAVSCDYIVDDADLAYKISENVIKSMLNNTNKKIRLIGVRLSRLIFEHEKNDEMQPLKSYFIANSSSIDDEKTKDKSEKFAPDEDIEAMNAECTEGPSQLNIKSEEQGCCPICGVVLPPDLMVVNSHVDECLSSEAIREMETPSPSPALLSNAPTKTRLADVRRKNETRSRRRMSGPKRRVVSHSIHDYFS